MTGKPSPAPNLACTDNQPIFPSLRACFLDAFALARAESGASRENRNHSRYIKQEVILYKNVEIYKTVTRTESNKIREDHRELLGIAVAYRVRKL